MALVLGTESRPVPDGSPSDAEIAKAARLYNSAGGTYELDGSALRYNRIVSIGPGRMLPENQPYVRQLVTLTSNRLETATTSTAGVTTTLKYARVEGVELFRPRNSMPVGPAPASNRFAAARNDGLTP